MQTVWALALAAGLPLAAAQVPATQNPKLVHQYNQLTADAAKQQGSKQAETLAKMAELEFEFARAGYRSQQPGDGDAQLDRATEHADRACALLQAETAAGKTNGMKNVEQSLQRITFGLKGLAQQVRYLQRPRVEAAIRHFSDLRDNLLDWMFAPKRNMN